ncbi:MAG: hypothetical protein SPD42_02135 [Eubacteriales bacterium]|nr:hypothetical protein [Eubacteriales bacterium]
MPLFFLSRGELYFKRNACKNVVCIVLPNIGSNKTKLQSSIIVAVDSERNYRPSQFLSTGSQIEERVQSRLFQAVVKYLDFPKITISV